MRSKQQVLYQSASACCLPSCWWMKTRNIFENHRGANGKPTLHWTWWSLRSKSQRRIGIYVCGASCDARPVCLILLHSDGRIQIHIPSCIDALVPATKKRLDYLWEAPQGKPQDRREQIKRNVKHKQGISKWYMHICICIYTYVYIHIYI